MERIIPELVLGPPAPARIYSMACGEKAPIMGEVLVGAIGCRWGDDVGGAGGCADACDPVPPAIVPAGGAMP